MELLKNVITTNNKGRLLIVALIVIAYMTLVLCFFELASGIDSFLTTNN